MSFTYPKIEKLCSKVLIDKLFEQNRRLKRFPLHLIWIETRLTSDIPVQSMVSISKRRFKRAVKRNLLKRRMREAFRLHKHDLYQTLLSGDKQIALAFIYQSNDILPYSDIEKSVIYLLNQLLKSLEIADE